MGIIIVFGAFCGGMFCKSCFCVFRMWKVLLGVGWVLCSLKLMKLWVGLGKRVSCGGVLGFGVVLLGRW